jgi:nucleobase:cation symporter-1, NCS1 family
VFALVNYVSYNTADAILSGSAMDSLFGMSANLGFVIAAAVAALLAIYGYHWIHRVNRVLAVGLAADRADGGADRGGVHQRRSTARRVHARRLPAPGLQTAFVIIAGLQLGWAVYVSDYSRYLPETVGVRSTFLWTYLPSALSGVWVFVLGAVMYAAAPADATPGAAFEAAGDSLFDGFGTVMIAALLVGLLAVMAINQYGGSLSMISIADSVTRVEATRRIRVVTILAMAVVVWALAQFVGEERFNEFYGNVLVFLAYLFTPWTAINLVDFFFVRRGIYTIREIFRPDGMYGRWGWRGNVSYMSRWR